MQIVKYAFQQHGDDRGMLLALEEYMIFRSRSSVFIICMIPRRELPAGTMRINP